MNLTHTYMCLPVTFFSPLYMYIIVFIYYE